MLTPGLGSPLGGNVVNDWSPAPPGVPPERVKLGEGRPEWEPQPSWDQTRILGYQGTGSEGTLTPSLGLD